MGLARSTEAVKMEASGGFTVEFWKMHGLGNDFVVIGVADALPDHAASLSVQWCDRHFGIGADGALFVLSGGLPGQDASFTMRMFNPDGSEAEMCGNGIRCVASFLRRKGAWQADELSIATLAGLQHLTFRGHTRWEDIVEVDMGRPQLDGLQIPTRHAGAVIDQPITVGGRTFAYTAVSMGNPHAVIFVEDPHALPLAEIGPQIEHHPDFPQRTNVEFVGVSGNVLTVDVWERGAGATLACGTGACAAAVAAAWTGRAPRETQVHLPGGTLQIRWAEDDHVHMTGPATVVFTGDWPDKEDVSA